MKTATASAAPLSLNEKRYLTIEEAAEYLSLSVNAIRHRMKRKTIPVYCMTHLGRSLRFLREELDALMVPNPAARGAVREADRARGRRLSVVRSHRLDSNAAAVPVSSQTVGERV